MRVLQLILLSFLLVPLALRAAGPSLPLESAGNDIQDQDSLQRGAALFTEYCMACHSVKYMRYNRIAADLGWSNDKVVEVMSQGQALPVAHVMTRMPEGVDVEVFGTQVPDLSLMARVKGTDYIYSFLRGYEYDPETETWDNRLLKGTAMPHVLADMQRHASPDAFAQAARDISNFLEYTGEPAKLQRLDLGWKVMLFLLLMIGVTYLLKKEYWRDIKH